MACIARGAHVLRNVYFSIVWIVMPVLRWINDDDARRAASKVPFHLLEKKAEYGDSEQAKENFIIHGDNVLALKALLPFYKGKVKCIYIDPPYNTGNAFLHYDDNLENSQWLSLMFPRLCLLREFLREDGAIWVQIDDDQQAYLKVLLDEIFGRENFITSICVKMSHLSGMKMSHIDKKIPKIKEFILLYAKNKQNFSLNTIYVPVKWNEVFSRYKSFLVVDPANPDDFDKWSVIPFNQAMKAEGFDPTKQDDIDTFGIKNASRIFRTARNSSEVFKNLPYDDRFRKIETASGMVKFAYKGEEVLFCSEKLHEINNKKTPVAVLGDIWTDIAINNLHNEGGVEFKNGKKPEKLVERVFRYSTSAGDLVLDSFLGSGTTAAVAQKMGRHFIGIEMGNQAITHCIPRLRNVIAGEQGGISKSVNWHGGGGFGFFELSDPVFDEYGSINPQVSFETLAAYVWQAETGCVGSIGKKPFLGEKKGVGIYLLYNGVLGDKRPESGNVLTPELLRDLLTQYPHEGPKVIYAEAMIGLDDLELREKRVSFKQIPYDIRD